MPTDPQSDPDAAAPAPAAAPPPRRRRRRAAPDKQGMGRIARITLCRAAGAVRLPPVRRSHHAVHLAGDDRNVPRADRTAGQWPGGRGRRARQPAGEQGPVAVPHRSGALRDRRALRGSQPRGVHPGRRFVRGRRARADAQLRGQRVDLAASEQLGKIVVDLAAKRALAETPAIRARADIDKTRAGLIRAEAEAQRVRVRRGKRATETPRSPGAGRARSGRARPRATLPWSRPRMVLHQSASRPGSVRNSARR